MASTMTQPVASSRLSFVPNDKISLQPKLTKDVLQSLPAKKSLTPTTPLSFLDALSSTESDSNDNLSDDTFDVASTASSQSTDADIPSLIVPEQPDSPALKLLPKRSNIAVVEQSQTESAGSTDAKATTDPNAIAGPRDNDVLTPSTSEVTPLLAHVPATADSTETSMKISDPRTKPNKIVRTLMGMGTAVMSGLNSFSEEIWGPRQLSSRETLVNGMKAALFAGGIYENYAQEKRKNEEEYQKKLQERFGEKVLDALKKTDKFMTERKDNLYQASIGLIIIGNLIYPFSLGSAIVRATGDVIFGAAESHDKTKENSSLTDLITLTNHLMDDKTKTLSLLDKVKLKTRDGLVLIKAAGNFVADLAFAGFIVQPFTSLAIVLSGRMIALAAFVGGQRIENDMLNKLVKTISEREKKRIGGGELAFEEQKYSAKQMLLDMSGIDFLVRPILGLISKIFPGVKSVLNKWRNLIDSEPESNRKSARQAAAASIHHGFEMGLSKLILPEVEKLIDNEKLKFAARNEEPAGKGERSAEDYLMVLRYMNMARLPEFENMGRLKLQNIAKDQVIGEIAALKESVKGATKTTTPFEDTKRILIEMAERGLLNNEGDKGRVIGAINDAKLDIESNKPFQELHELCEKNFKHGDPAEFVMNSNTKADMYVDKHLQEISHGILIHYASQAGIVDSETDGAAVTKQQQRKKLHASLNT